MCDVLLKHEPEALQKEKRQVSWLEYEFSIPRVIGVEPQQIRPGSGMGVNKTHEDMARRERKKTSSF